MEYGDYYHTHIGGTGEAKEGDDKDSKKPDYNEVDQQEEEIGELKKKQQIKFFELVNKLSGLHMIVGWFLSLCKPRLVFLHFQSL